MPGCDTRPLQRKWPMTRPAHIATIVFALSVTPFMPVANAMSITQLELTGGGSSNDGRFHRMLDRLLDRDGTLVMGQYQPTPEIVPPYARRHRNVSLFTSGVSGAPPPSATISGASITVDLSSLYFGITRGDHLRAWNIGGIATGSFDPETLEFRISWEHLIKDRSLRRPAMFKLQGQVVPSEVPIPAGAVLFASGLAVGLVAFRWKRSIPFQLSVTLAGSRS